MKHIAQGLASLGRGPDTELVHMTKGEIAGLQNLALRHGGTLTINPHTGLVEAGFLSAILPMAAAAVGTYFGGPAGGAAAGALVGGVTNKKNPLMGAVLGGMAGYSMGTMGAGFAAEGGAAVASEAGLNMATAAGNVGTGTQFATDALMKEAATNAALEGTALPSYYESMIPAQLTPTQLAQGNAQRVMALDQIGMGPAPAAPSYGDNMMRGIKDQWNKPSGVTDYLTDKTDMYKNARNVAGIATSGYGLYKLGELEDAKAATAPDTSKPSSYRAMSPYALDTYSPVTNGRSNEVIQVENPYARSRYAMGGPIDPNSPLQAQSQSQAPVFPGSGISQAAVRPMQQSVMPSEVIGGYDPAMGMYSGEPVRMADGGEVPNALIKNPPPAAPAAPANFDQYLTGLAQRYYDKLWRPAVENGGSIDNLNVPISDILGTTNTGATKAGAMPPNPYSINPAYEAHMQEMAKGNQAGVTGMAGGGLAGLTYAAGGKLLQGPGDGMSDSIPAVIQGDKPQRAALAQGEFVVPADVVSHLGNGSTDAGSKRLYAMMDKIRKARTGTKKQGRQINPAHFMPA